MKRLALAAMILIGGCQPAPAPPTFEFPRTPVPAGLRSEAGACETQRGDFRQVGKAQTWVCVHRYADAGKRCTDGDQCAGACEADSEASTVGRCQVDDDGFGCRTLIDKGRATTICID